jgi:hypothetical protein
VLLAWRGTKKGSVWFWDHDTAEITFLRPSFAEFLRGLMPDPDEDAGNARGLPPAVERIAIAVPRTKAEQLRRTVEALGTRAEKLGLGEISGETDRKSPPTYVWIFKSFVDGAKLRKFLGDERRRKPALAPAMIFDWKVTQTTR